MSPLDSPVLSAAGTLRLQTPFVDVRGDSLRWTLEPVPRTPLAVREVALPGGLQVSLRVLGASHQVLVRHGERALLSETVACDLADAAAMPGEEARPGYTFTSTVDLLAPAELAARVAELADRLDGRGDAIVAAFPGAPDAVTALALDPGTTADTIVWHTWHAYPQTGELVRTTTCFHHQEVDHVE